MDDMYNKTEPEQSYYNRPVKKKKKGKGSLVLLALVCSLLGGLIGGAIVHVAGNSQGSQQALEGQQAININTSSDMGVVEAVAEKTLPSVVGITTQITQDTWLGPIQAQGSGSGVIVDSRGYILTNSHVVNGGQTQNVTVLLSDGTDVPGQVIYADSEIDIAIVKIESEINLIAAELGDSDNINIGETAVAIGNPLGTNFQRSVTAGVVSGLNRNLGNVQGNYMDGLIQTDASINNGNSGGPLLNAEGEVIGLNTVKIASQGTEGLGFSIPINTIKPIVESVVENGNYQRVTLGITGGSVEDIQKEYNYRFPSETGVIVSDIVPGSPAEQAGLTPADIITELNGQAVGNMSDLKNMLMEFNVGDTVTIKIIRNEQEMEVQLTFTDYQGSVQN